MSTGPLNRQPLKVLHGGNGTLELYPDRLIIRKRGLQSRFTPGVSGDCKAVYLRDITGVTFNPGKFQYVGSGCVQFMTAENGVTMVYDRRHDSIAHDIVDYIASQTGVKPLINTEQA